MSTDTAATDTPSGGGGGRRRLPVLEGVLPLDRKRLPVDLLAGTTLAALGIPEVMGYAKIAGMPVVTGLYTILIPIAIFAILGSSRHLVVGADSATAAILAAGLAPLAAAGSSEYVALASGVAIITGVVLVVARIIRLGLPRRLPVAQRADRVPHRCRHPGRDGPGQRHARRLRRIRRHAGEVRRRRCRTSATRTPPPWLVSLGVLVVILGCRKIDKRIPGALIAVVGAIFVSWKWDLARRRRDARSGRCPAACPRSACPTSAAKDLPSLLATVGAIVLVILAQSAATSRAYAAKYQEQFSENTDLVGLGAANVAAGVTGTFVVNGSPTKTQMVDTAGGRSQLAQLTTAAVVLVVLLFLTKPLQYMPNAVLAAVVFLIGVELVDVAGMKGIWAVRKDEFAIAAVTALLVVVVGVEQGVVLAIVLSILDYVRRGYQPSRSLVIQTPSGHFHGRPLDTDAAVRPGLLVYRFGADLFYANANGFSEDVLALAAEPGVRWICIDCGGDQRRGLLGLEDPRRAPRRAGRARRSDLVLADLTGDVRTELERYGVLAQVGTDSVFASVGDAVDAFDALPAGSGSPTSGDDGN